MKPTRTLPSMLAACSITLGALCSPAAHAANVSYTGVVDSGPLAGSLFDGRFSYDDPAPGHDGAVGLTGFTLNFNAQSYTLASGDAPALAWFAGGSFVGLDYVDLDSSATAVQLTAGFSNLSEAFLSYQTTGAAQGLGGFTRFTAESTVPEPAPLALLLGALAAAGVASRLQRHQRQGN